MERSTAKLLTVLTWIAMIVATLFSEGRPNALLIIAAVGIVILLILSRWLRCPKCKRNQGRDWFHMEYCPYCGTHLDD